MKTHSKLDPRCRDIRHRLPDFLREKLGVVATGEVQGHLLTCQSCSEVLGELLMRAVESGTEPLRTPPRIPSTDLYDAYLQRPNPFGVIWGSVRAALQSADAAVRDWAQKQAEQISAALNPLLTPLPSAPVRVRGGVRTRGGATTTASPVTATVLSSTWEPTGQTVTFSVEEDPRITTDGHFRLRLKTRSTSWDGCTVFCTIAPPDMLPISFRGTLRGGEVEIDEGGILGVEGNLEVDGIKIAVAKI
jgi:hypothetical protein